MLYIKDNGEIQLTRGDSAYLEVPLVVKTIDGSEVPYEIAADDTLVMSVKSSTDDTVYCFQKTLVGSNMFHIEPIDTCHCAFGKYKYDVQLTTAAGDVYTVVEPTCFRVLPEVTH